MLSELFSFLSQEERDRALKFRFEANQVEFIVARGVLRKVLGKCLNLAPRSVGLLYGKYGKPRLNSASSLQFSVSHAGDLVVYALSLNRRIGIDVERFCSIPDLDAVAERFFFDEELLELLRLEGEKKENRFFEFWTRGEALLKWCGKGMAEPEYRQRLKRRFNGSIVPLRPAAGYFGAVAVSGQDFELATWQWPLEREEVNFSINSRAKIFA